jgi:hypothetical protein
MSALNAKSFHARLPAVVAKQGKAHCNASSLHLTYLLVPLFVPLDKDEGADTTQKMPVGYMKHTILCTEF